MSQPDSEPLSERLFPNQEWVLLVLLAIEGIVFGVAGKGFLSAANGLEIVRLSVELGLLAVALTPVIITGGIDLSVGSMMGLAAVIFGLLWRDARMPIALAAVAALAVGFAGGSLNALLVARFGMPPLIVTLGSFSLFRGIAEGLTGGVDNITNFPAGFLFLGQGYVFGVPAQVPVFLLVVIVYWLALHRTTLGRSLYAIGFSAEGARHAGIPVSRRLALVYVQSGVVSSIAAILYVAHLGQAKADAGTAYEILAITAVVLGGASIFGGRGTIHGSVLGLLVIAILGNGLRLAALPAELGGILVGVLLVVAIGAGRQVGSRRRLVFAGLVGFVLVASVAAGSFTTSGKGAMRLTVAMMPKAVGDPYFVSCRKGAEEAARELGVELLWDGPTELDPAKQNEVVEAWITRKVDVIAVSVENRAGLSTVLRKARERGIKVLTWDADAERDARDYLINQATPQGIGYTLTDHAARILGGKGEFAIVTASLTAANQNEWIRYIRERMAERYPGLKLAVIRPSEGDRDRAFAETQTILKVYPDVKLVMAIAAPAVPGAAEAVRQSGRSDVRVIGLSLPNMCRPYIKSGVIDCIVLWNTIDLGYLTVETAYALGTGALKSGVTRLAAGRLGSVEVRGDEVLLGVPYTFNKDNVDRFDF